MKKGILACIAALTIFTTTAQSPGDTIRVKAFDFFSEGRDTLVAFPSNNSLTYEKILLKYTMRCQDAEVNNGVPPVEGCRDFDLSCNTYVVDSTKIEAELNTVLSHTITNFEGTNFPFRKTPVYDILRGSQTDVEIVKTIEETAVAIGSGSGGSNLVLATENIAGKSQYLYTAAELQAAGLVAGEIDALSLTILSEAGTANFLEINLQHTSRTELNGDVDLDGFTRVYAQNTTLEANTDNRFNFSTPFMWDGSSNLLVEYNFTNLGSDNNIPTLVEVDESSPNSGLEAVNENEILLTSNAFVETNEYTGILGNQNRTLEAWIRTTEGTEAEIMSWGVNTTGRRFTWRLDNGALRLEVQGGGVNSTSTVDDGEWHHVACVLNGNTPGDVSFYIDGVFDPNTGTNATNIDTQPSTVRISRGTLGRFLDATVDEVRMWDTALTEETINEWRSLKVNEAHPNFANLQLYYNFNETGDQVFDQSVNGRDASIFSGEYRVATRNGQDIFKAFTPTNQRPNTVFFQGEYLINDTTTTVDRPIVNEPQNFVLERSIIETDPTLPFPDIVEEAVPVEHWGIDQRIYDEITGELIDETTLSQDGEIDISDLEFFRRFPFFNEIVSLVTPFGIGLDFGVDGESWFFDLTDFTPILNGDKRVLITLGGQFQTELDLEFLFIVGTPPRDVLQFDQIWQGSNRTGGNPGIPVVEILDDLVYAPLEMPLVAGASEFKLRSSITGHGTLGEFPQNGGLVEHIISIDGQEQFVWDIFRECGLNPIFPQGGTWLFNRNGWCPSRPTLITEQDLTPFVSAGSMLNIDYTTSIPPGGINNNYRYHAAHQVVAYGPPNFNQDAAVVQIAAPNNTADFRRVGNSCGAPMITIRNTGATSLTSLTITYWLNESITPQTFEWSGNLAFMEEAQVELPAVEELWFDIQNANNRFNVEVSNPNGGADDYSFNNIMSSTIDVPIVIPNDMAVFIRTNNAFTQNSYTLFDGDGNIIGSNDLPTANTNFIDDYSLEDGCYRLVIEDTAGDGLSHFASTAQGNGFARIVNPGNTGIIEILEDDFGSELGFSFTTDFLLSTEDLEFATSIKLYPNPTSNFATIEANDLSNTAIQLVDIAGRVIAPTISSRSEGSVTLNLQNLSSGVYFVVLENELIRTSRKIVVQ